MSLPRPAPATRTAPVQSGAVVIRPASFQRVEVDLSTLVARSNHGDRAAQEALFNRFSGDVERILFRLLGNDFDVAEALQDVFLHMFRGLHRIREPKALPGWLRVVAVGTARKRIRSKVRRRWLRFLPHDEVPDVATQPVDDELLSAVHATFAVLDTMGTELRIAFSLRYLEQLELTEVAEACGVSLATVKRRIKKAEALFVVRARSNPHLVDWVDNSRWKTSGVTYEVNSDG